MKSGGAAIWRDIIQANAGLSADKSALGKEISGHFYPLSFAVIYERNACNTPLRLRRRSPRDSRRKRLLGRLSGAELALTAGAMVQAAKCY